MLCGGSAMFTGGGLEPQKKMAGVDHSGHQRTPVTAGAP